jgi:RNA recognition motif-containing protein
LETLFGVYGEIVSAKVIFDKETGNSKGYGFVEMKNDEEADRSHTSIERQRC